jgi:hypothetical protein
MAEPGIDTKAMPVIDSYRKAAVRRNLRTASGRDFL